MDTRPEPTPEGKLIDDAAALADISIREAARRAGISYGRWRQIVKGFQNISPGVYAPVRNAPAKTIAKMAAATGNVTPAQLTEAGRDDAAVILAGLLPEDTTPEPSREPAEPVAADVKAQVYALFRQVNEDIEAQVRAEIRHAKAAYRSVPLSEVPESGAEPGDTNLPGAAITTFSTFERAIWDLSITFDEEESRARLIIDARAAAAARAPRVRRAGLRPPDVLTA